MNEGRVALYPGWPLTAFFQHCTRKAGGPGIYQKSRDLHHDRVILKRRLETQAALGYPLTLGIYFTHNDLNSTFYVDLHVPYTVVSGSQPAHA